MTWNLMRKCFAATVAVGLVAAGCGLSTTDEESARTTAAVISSGDCIKIEGIEIGLAPQTLNVGGIEVTIVSWTPKANAPGEYVGFTYTTNGGTVEYVVKAGIYSFEGSDTTWTHPAGARVRGISNITFCPGELPPPPPPPDAGTPEDCSTYGARGCACTDNSQCAQQTCKWGSCLAGPTGVPCRENGDCISYRCENSVCVDPPPQP